MTDPRASRLEQRDTSPAPHPATSLGFTWQDVDDEHAELAGLIGQLNGWRRKHPNDDGSPSMRRLEDRIQRKRDRADRIAALLPPRET